MTIIQLIRKLPNTFVEIATQNSPCEFFGRFHYSQGLDHENAIRKRPLIPIKIKLNLQVLPNHLSKSQSGEHFRKFAKNPENFPHFESSRSDPEVLKEP